MICFFSTSFLGSADGNAKIYSWTNGNGGTLVKNGTDQMSTLSRPISAEAISNGTLPKNNRNASNGVLSRSTGGLHEDADFPTSQKSLARRKPIVWMRPHVSD